MSEDDKQDGRRVRPFADFLAEHNRGAGATEAAEALQAVVGAVLDTGKKGSVTLQVSVEPMKNTPDTLLTTVTVSSKVPAQPVKAAVFYADSDHNLSRTDPNQLQFDSLREVEGGEGVKVLREPGAPKVAGGDA